MKRRPIDALVYLDTNIYNALIKEENFASLQDIARAVVERRIRIFFSITNLEELMGIYTSCPDKTTKVFKLTREICMSHRAPQAPPLQLILAEFNHLGDSTVRINLYSNKAKFIDWFLERWEVLANNPNIEGQKILRINEEIKEENIRTKDGFKEAKEKMSTHIKEGVFTAKTPEDFINQMLSGNAYINDFIKEFLENKVNNPRITVDMVRENWSKMRGFYQYYWYSILGIVYAHNFAAGKPPDRGDQRDIHHAIYASYSDIFVSNDEPFRKYLKYVPGNKHSCFNLDEFVQYLKTSVD